MVLGLAALINVPMMAQTPSQATDTTKPVFAEEFDTIVQTARLTPLRSTSLDPGQREIRVWIGGGIGYPQNLYRIVDRGAGRVTGSLIFHWPADSAETAEGEIPGQTFNDVIVYHQRGRCVNFRRSNEVGVCEARFVQQPSWESVLRNAEKVGLWTLPDPASLPKDDMLFFDGWGISVELRDGPTYRAYSYGNPDSRKWPEAKLATKIADAFRSVDSLVRPSVVEKTYRGVYSSGPSLSKFQPCGSKEKWGFQGNIGASAWSNKPRSDTTTVGITQKLVEVRGSLAQDWVVRQWGSEYKRVLEVSKVLSARSTWSTSCP